MRRMSQTDRTSAADGPSVAGVGAMMVFALLFAAAVLSGCASGYTGGGTQGNTNPGTAGQVNARDAAGNNVGVGQDGRGEYGEARGDAGAVGGADF
jgi:hypothetical protein